MARARNIKPGFFKNEDLAELPAETRLLFIGLWTLADREGRLEDRPRRIKAELFAFDSFDIESMLSELQSKSFLVRYDVDGGRYIQITNFVKHQDPHYRERASEIPPPPGVSNSIKATNVTRTQRQRIFERDGFRCQKCGATEQLSIDHVVAVANGGDSSDCNLQVLCYSCNFEKRAKDGEASRNIEPSSTGPAPGQPPLIPDSLIPDSLIPDSRTTSPSGDVESAGDSATAMLAAYHRILPNCKRIHVLNPKRLKRFREAEKLAKRVCREQGWEYEPAVFWAGYFTVCADDEWLRGDKPNPNNPAWKQSIDVLLAEDRFAGIMDDAITAIKTEAAA